MSIPILRPRSQSTIICRRRLQENFVVKLRLFSILSMVLLMAGAWAPCGRAQSPAPADIDSPVADKWALVVGVSRFKNASLNLQWAAKDAEDFRNYLVSKGQFDPEHVKLLTNEQ